MSLNIFFSVSNSFHLSKIFILENELEKLLNYKSVVV